MEQAALGLAFGFILAANLVAVFGAKRTPTRQFKAPAMTRKKEDWEYEGEAWKQRNVPDATGDSTPSPEPTPAKWFHTLGRRIQCGKCAARNEIRAGKHHEKYGVGPSMDEPLPALPMRFRVRGRDCAYLCYICGEAAYPMSEDTVMQYDPRYHWRGEPEPDTDEKEAA